MAVFRAVTVDEDNEVAFPDGKDLLKVLTSGTLASAVPGYSGQLGINTSNGLLYRATGTDAGDWERYGIMRTLGALSENSLYEGEVVKYGGAYYFSTGTGTANWEGMFIEDFLIENVQTTDYVLAASDHGRPIVMNSSSPKLITIPLNATVPIPVGFQGMAIMEGTGTVTIAPEVGVTLKAAEGFLTIGVRYAMATYYKASTNVWRVGGRLE